ncbi:hypothetical protein WMW72_09795 [Paenibacillus filicis]|uniref:Uncharacterized protein n=1 Tax=Paenibacillus filicis TaxID=669464 RepID=A0ABU9DH46_9BACL
MLSTLKWLVIAAAVVHFISVSNDSSQSEVTSMSQTQESKQTELLEWTDEQRERVNFGKYELPPTLRKLNDVQQELGGTEQLYDALHFYLVEGDSRYFNTPSDVVVFGTTGMDGIHYGFLTDYGTVADLEEAPVVCVSPMDFDRPVWLVARNLREFLRLNLTDADLTINHFQDEPSYLEAKRQFAEEAAASPYQPSEEELRSRQEAVSLLLKRIELPEIVHPFGYLETVREERLARITVQTQDGLGVTEPLEAGHESAVLPIRKDKTLEPDALKRYLAEASRASKLALFRDIQMHMVLSEEREVRTMVVAELRRLGLAEEAGRIEAEG